MKRYHSRPGRPSVTDPTRHPPRRARSVKIRECWAGPGWPFVTDPNSVTDGRHHDPQAGSAIENAAPRLVITATGSAIENAEAGSAGELKCRIIVSDRRTHTQPELI